MLQFISVKSLVDDNEILRSFASQRTRPSIR